MNKKEQGMARPRETRGRREQSWDSIWDEGSPIYIVGAVLLDVMEVDCHMRMDTKAFDNR